MIRTLNDKIGTKQKKRDQGNLVWTKHVVSGRDMMINS